MVYRYPDNRWSVGGQFHIAELIMVDLTNHHSACSLYVWNTRHIEASNSHTIYGERNTHSYNNPSETQTGEDYTYIFGHSIQCHRFQGQLSS